MYRGPVNASLPHGTTMVITVAIAARPYPAGMNSQPPRMLRVVGPPGSGKTLLITSLVEALRSRGHRIATVSRREATVTVIALSTGSRVTLEQPATVEALRSVVAAIDPQVDLVLAEGYDDAGVPAVEVRPTGAPAFGIPQADLVAVVEAEALAAAFARSGPGDTLGVAERIEAALFGGAQPGVPGPSSSEPPPAEQRRRWPFRQS